MKRSMITLMLAALTVSACVKEEVVVPARSNSGIGPALVIDQFMRALNSDPKDLVAMGRLFGTKEGPIGERDPRPQVEQRMFAIGTVLHHDDYEIVGEQQVPGRSTEATLFLVRVKAGQKTHTVPFTMVRYGDGGWLIEQIGIDVITHQR